MGPKEIRLNYVIATFSRSIYRLKEGNITDLRIFSQH
jgi:hypothetical protein